MPSNLRMIWVEAPPIVRATLDAAWSASKVGAISLATLLTIANLAFGTYDVAKGNMNILELPGVMVGGAFIFVLSLLFGLVVAVPMSGAIATCAYPFLRILQAPGRQVFGVVGLSVGALGMFWNGPTGNLYFGSWISVFAIGGLAGRAGGLAFAEHFPVVTSATSDGPPVEQASGRNERTAGSGPDR